MDTVILLLLAILSGFFILRGIEGIIKKEKSVYLNLSWIGFGYWIFYTFLNFLGILPKYELLIFTNVPFAYLSALSIYFSKKQTHVGPTVFRRILWQNSILPAVLFLLVVPVYFYPKELKLLFYECSIHLASLNTLLQIDSGFRYAYVAQVLIEYGAKVFAVIYILKFMLIKTDGAFHAKSLIPAFFIFMGATVALMGGIFTNLAFHVGGILAFIGMLYFHFAPEALNRTIDTIVIRKYSHTKNLPMDQIEFKIEQILKGEKAFRDSDLTLPKLARSLGISTHQLSEFINDRYQMSFNSFLNQFRIDEAKRMLVDNPEHNVLEISLEVGFNSRSSFNSVFKNSIGMSPKEFRIKNVRTRQLLL